MRKVKRIRFLFLSISLVLTFIVVAIIFHSKFSEDYEKECNYSNCTYQSIGTVFKSCNVNILDDNISCYFDGKKCPPTETKCYLISNADCPLLGTCFNAKIAHNKNILLCAIVVSLIATIFTSLFTYEFAELKKEEYYLLLEIETKIDLENMTGRDKKLPVNKQCVICLEDFVDQDFYVECNECRCDVHYMCYKGWKNSSNKTSCLHCQKENETTTYEVLLEKQEPLEQEAQENEDKEKADEETKPLVSANKKEKMSEDPFADIV